MTGYNYFSCPFRSTSDHVNISDWTYWAIKLTANERTSRVALTGQMPSKHMKYKKSISKWNIKANRVCLVHFFRLNDGLHAVQFKNDIELHLILVLYRWLADGCIEQCQMQWGRISRKIKRSKINETIENSFILQKMYCIFLSKQLQWAPVVPFLLIFFERANTKNKTKFNRCQNGCHLIGSIECTTFIFTILLFFVSVNVTDTI